MVLDRLLAAHDPAASRASAASPVSQRPSSARRFRARAFGWLAVTVLAWSASACATADESTDPAVEAAARDGASGEAATPSEASATGTRATDLVDASAATQDPARGNQDPIQDQVNRVLLENYLALAERLRGQGTESSLQAARQELLKAREIAPEDERVNNMLAAVNVELGLPAGTADTFAEEQLRIAAINEQRNRSEVMAQLDSARTALEQQNYARALQDTRAALQTIEIGTYIDWGDLEATAKELEAEAIRARDEAERAEMAALQAEVSAQRRAAEAKDAARKKALVDGLLNNAAKAFELRKFEKAQDFAREAMDIAPNNQVARELHNASIKAAREYRNDVYYRDVARAIRRMREEAEDLRIPQTDVLYVDPEVWERASQRQVQSGVTAAEENPDDVALRELVTSTRLSGLSFTEEDGAYEDVVKQINLITQIPIIITPDARDVIDGEGLVMVIDITAPMSVANFLEQMVSRSEELAWTIEDGVVKITTKAQAGGKNIFDLKDVRDLIFAKTAFLPPTIRDIPSGEESETPRTGGEGEDPIIFVELDQLILNLKDATGIDYWESEGGGTIADAEAGYLLVHANRKMHAQIDRVLEDLRRFATTVVTIESKFLQISQNFLQEIGVDFRGLGGSGAKGQVAQLDDITNGLDDNASRGLDNSGTLDPAGKPSSGAFFNDGGDGDVRGRTENYFGSALGNALTSNGGVTAALTFLDDLQLQAIIRAVEKRQDVQELNSQNLTVQNNERGHVAIINQTAYVRDFEVEVAQAAFIADPIIDVIQDGVVLDVQPTVSYDRKKITLKMEPTVAELVRPIPTFSTSLAGTTQPVTIQLPQLLVRSFATTVDVPDGASVLIGGLREVLAKERRAEVPLLGKIPLLSFFFKQEGIVDENTSLMVLVRASVTDLRDYVQRR